MHRQAMLMSLSLSPATALVNHNSKHWAFLEEIDAPQWVDFTVEAALEETVGDDPWFSHSHLHHEVPLKELNGVQLASRNDCSTKNRLEIERKNSGASKTQCASQTFKSLSENTGSELKVETPLVVKVASQDQICARNQINFVQPQSLEHENDIDVARLCMEDSCAPASEHELLTNEEDANELPPLSLDTSPVVCKAADRLLDIKQQSSPSFNPPSAIGDAARIVVSQLEGRETDLPQLNNALSLCKSSASLLGVKVNECLNFSITGGFEAVHSPKSGSTDGNVGCGTTAVSKASSLGCGTRVDVIKGGARKVDCAKTESSLESDVLGTDGGLIAEEITSGPVPMVGELERVQSGTNCFSLERCSTMDGRLGTSKKLNCRSSHDGVTLSSRLGANSSVHAFDDIQKMRKSWGSSLWVRRSEDLQTLVSEGESNNESDTLTIRTRDVRMGSLSPLSEESPSMFSPIDVRKEKGVVLDTQPALQDEVVHMKLEGAQLSKRLLAGLGIHAATVEHVAASCEGQPSKRTREQHSTRDLRFPSKPSIPAGGSAKQRQSMSLGYLEKGTKNEIRSSNWNGSVQQNHHIRVSPLSQPHAILSRVYSSRGGKENSALQSSPKSNTGTGQVQEKKTRQSILRMSMPSFSAGTVTRQAVGGGVLNKSTTILEKSGEVQVPTSSQSISRKSCVRSSTTMSLGHHKSPSNRMDASSRRKPPNGPSSAVRTSMPAFSSAILRQTGRPVHNAEASSTHEGKNSKQIWR
ncbi:unnamed protein product [Sphagnum jensenii]|uniref:Uncharacterized protein n=1 Tax=Sphagnum jensenii TaxID=128206 RepID=A0ABP1AMF2_9BRYO